MQFSLNNDILALPKMKVLGQTTCIFHNSLPLPVYAIVSNLYKISKMAKLNFECVKHERGIMLYLTDEKQLYYKHEQRSTVIVYKCKNKKCKCRVAMKDDECTRFSSMDVHNHSDDAELYYTRLIVFNKILAAQEDALLINKQISVRRLFDDINIKNNVKLSYEKCKRSLYRQLSDRKRIFRYKNHNNSNILPESLTEASSSSIVSTKNMHTLTPMAHSVSRSSCPHLQLIQNSTIVVTNDQTLSLKDTNNKITVLNDILLLKPTSSTWDEHKQQPSSSISNLLKNNKVQIPLKKFILDNEKGKKLITIPNDHPNVPHKDQPSLSSVSCSLKDINNKIPVVVMHDITTYPAYRNMIQNNFSAHTTKSVLHTGTPFEETRKKWIEFVISSNNNQPQSSFISPNEKLLRADERNDCEPSTSKSQFPTLYVKSIETPSGLDILGNEEISIHLDRSIETVFLAEHIKEEEELFSTLRTEDTHDINGICGFRQVNVIIAFKC